MIRRLFLYYCFSNNGVIDENYLIIFFLRAGFRALLVVVMGINVWGSLFTSIVTNDAKNR